MPLKILIVENESMYHRAMRRVLEVTARRAGKTIEIFIAESVSEAYAHILEHPDLSGMLLDASLGSAQELDAENKPRPDMAVLLLLAHLRLKYPSLVIVASSGEPSCNDRLIAEGCRDGGGKDVAPKKLIALLTG